MCIRDSPYYFGTLGKSLLSISTLTTVHSWTTLYMITAYGCAHYPVEHLESCVDTTGSNTAAVLFFVSYGLIALAIALGMFTGAALYAFRATTLQQSGLSSAMRRCDELLERLTALHQQADSNTNVIGRLKRLRRGRDEWLPRNVATQRKQS
eukprot:TRINITY_DN7602_c0_g1_i1.p1 TRINITY_DN7602_c0_g1~~TRINITY_DN7602_c0_g1_i1.p1  ORF type:complete len:152 (-),score=40.36 TRINITY_DN7602_c0_g1_i1:45-500(-)